METLMMSNRKRLRLEVVSQVQARKLTLVKGSELLQVSYRQMKRIWHFSPRTECFGIWIRTHEASRVGRRLRSDRRRSGSAGIRLL